MRCICIKDELADAIVDMIELLSMGRPIRSSQEKVSEDLFTGFWNELAVSEGFVVAIIVDKSSNVNKDLVNCNLFELGSN